MQKASLVRAMRWLRVALVVFGLAAAPDAALLPAQAPRATLDGVVTDPTGAPLAGARIRATRVQTDERRETVTTPEGRYSLPNLPAGAYRVTATAPGFQESVREISLAGAAPARADFELRLLPIVQVITVTEPTETARVTLERVPGGTTLIAPEEIQQTRAAHLQDVLAFAPGVLAQSRFGSDESQLSIRGSGLRNNFHMRGLNILMNGIPYQDADGFSDFEAIDLAATQRIEVWKGANALRFGGNSMGGALNLVTHTGETASPLQLRAEGGSFGYFRGQLSSGGVRGPLSYYLSLSDTEYNGYREHSNQGRQRWLSNLGWKLTDRTELRFDLIYANVAERLPGALTREEFFADPRQANPTNVAQDWGRFYNYGRLAVTLRQRVGEDDDLAVSLYGQYRDMDHPIFQVLDQDARNFGGELYYRAERRLGGRANRFVIGFTPQVGTTGERRFQNLAGQRGPITALFGTEARNYGVFFENQLDLARAFTFVVGGRADWAQRKFDDKFLADGDRSDERRFSAFSPKVGFVWQAAEAVQLFGNVSRSYEPPLLLELTSCGAPGFLDLQAQDAWQFEFGSRGRLGSRAQWDAAFFDVEISNEIINLNVQPFPGAPFTIPSYRNASGTRHRGLELGGTTLLKEQLFGANDRLTWRTAYTWSHFRFRDDPDFGNNFLAGAPRHLVRSELRYHHPRGLWLAPLLDWSPATYFMDSANTARNDKYAVLSVRAGYDLRRATLYFEAANLTDRLYSGSVQVDNALGRFFEPSAGRSLHAGLRWRF
jgi:iron complex outermembrane receptor protein